MYGCGCDGESQVKNPSFGCGFYSNVMQLHCVQILVHYCVNWKGSGQFWTQLLIKPHIFTCFENHVCHGLVLWSTSPCGITQGVLVLQTPAVDMKIAGCREALKNLQIVRFVSVPMWLKWSYMPLSSDWIYDHYLFHFSLILMLVRRSQNKLFSESTFTHSFSQIGFSSAKIWDKVNFVSCRFFY